MYLNTNDLPTHPMTLAEIRNWRKGERGIVSLPEEEEAYLIKLAKHGDELAWRHLVLTYMPILRKRVLNAKSAVKGMSERETQHLRQQKEEGFWSDAWTAFQIVITDHDLDKSNRLAYTMEKTLDRVFAQSRSEELPIIVKPDMLSRYFRHLRRAGHDQEAARARAIAENAANSAGDGMPAKTWDLIHDAIRGVVSIPTTEDEGQGHFEYQMQNNSSDPYYDVLVRLVAAELLSQLEGVELQATRLHFGFEDDSLPLEYMKHRLDKGGLTDGKIADLLGVSRQMVQRARKSALAKMSASTQATEVN